MQPTLMAALLAEDQDFGGASSDPAYIDGAGPVVGVGGGGGSRGDPVPPRSFGEAASEAPPLPASNANNSSSASATTPASHDSAEVVRLASALQEFYTACGVKKSDVDLRRSARTFAGALAVSRPSCMRCAFTLPVRRAGSSAPCVRLRHVSPRGLPHARVGSHGAGPNLTALFSVRARPCVCVCVCV
jgi:hypothetical protein